MAMIKCKMCGGNLEIIAENSVATCEYCGTQQTVPNADNEKKMTLFGRANRLRMACEFDKAAGVYESIVAEFPEEAEAYWGLVLCKYGIEYVDDPATGKKIPTCHRSSFECVMDDSNLEQVLENADSIARRVYREEARVIEELRKGIIEISGKEEPYDIFICYKETAENGERTIDSVIAQDVYDALVEKGYRVFFSRITLEDKLGQEYEPYIFAALHSAKIMLAFGTDYEYYNAVWVKNEWSRFLQLVAAGEKKTLIPCYKGIDAYDMPKEFARLQAQDMGKVGAIQDLLRGIEKILPREKAETMGTVVAQQNGNNSAIAPLLKRVFMFLEDEEWESADEYCEKVLDIDPECAEAYLGKLMVELQVCRREQLCECKVTFERSNNYQKALRFASEALAAELTGDNLSIEKRNQRAAVIVAYRAAEQTENDATSKELFDCAAEQYEQVYVEMERSGITAKDEPAAFYHDARERAALCREKGLEAGYKYACRMMHHGTFSHTLEAICLFQELSGWKDAEEKIDECEKIIGQLEAQAEENRKKEIYDAATKSMTSSDITEIRKAQHAFAELSGWRDADERAKKCAELLIIEEEKREKDRIYENAVRLAAKPELGYQREAAIMFAKIPGWRDADELADACLQLAETLESSELWRSAGRCQYCGGELKGLFSKKCSSCGKPKDY